MRKGLISGLKVILLILVVLALVPSCRPHSPSMGGGNIRPDDKVPSRLTSDEYKIATFEKGSAHGFWARNDRGNGHPFNCEFRSSNISFADGIMTLTLNRGASQADGPRAAGLQAVQ